MTRAVIIGMSLVVACAGVWVVTGKLAQSMRPNVSVLHGNMEHDFGEQVMPEGALRLEHRFQLRNISSHSVKVVRTASTCGCAAAILPDILVAPGQEVEIPVTLTISEPSVRHETVWVELDLGPSLALRVKARARRDNDFFSTATTLRISTTDWTTCYLVALTPAGLTTPPAAPQVEGLNGLECSFLGWREVFEGDDGDSRPARWHGCLQVRRSPTALLEGESISIRAFGKSIQLAIRPGP